MSNDIVQKSVSQSMREIERASCNILSGRENDDAPISGFSKGTGLRW